MREYLVDLNATQAAIRAGYSKRTAGSQSCDLLKRPRIQDAISRGAQKRAERTELKADDVVRELMLLGFSDVGDAFDENGRMRPLREMGPTRRVLASVEVDDREEGPVRKVRLWDKLKALELLGRHLQLFIDKTDITAEVKVTDAADVRSTVLARLAALRDAGASGGGTGGTES